VIVRVGLWALAAMLLLTSCVKQAASTIGMNSPQSSVSIIGTRIVFEIDVDPTRREMLDNLTYDIRKTMRQHRIGYKISQPAENRVSICVLDDARIADALSALRLLIGMPDEKIGGGVPVYQIVSDARKCIAVEETAEFREAFLNDVMPQEMESVKYRAALAPQLPAKTQRLSIDRFQLDIPEVLELKQVRDMFARSADLALRLVNENVTDDDILRNQVPQNTDILEQMPQDGKTLPPLAVYRATVLSGIRIEHALSVTAKHTGMPAVSVYLDKRGAEAFADFTKKNIGRRLAIVFDGKVLEAPLIVAPISGGWLQITGNFTQDQAQALSDQLNEGAVPRMLKIIDAHVTALSKP
jgi:preprotein translocase subunit SecD